MLHQLHQRMLRVAMLLALGAAAGMLYGALGVVPDADGASYAYPAPTDTPVPVSPPPAYPAFLPSLASD
jgi:hypothetical protein